VLHEQFRAGSVRDAGGFTAVWRESALFSELRSPASAGACASCGSYDACRGGCMASKFFTGLPLDGPDPECVYGHGETALRTQPPPHPGPGHSKTGAAGGGRREPVFVTLGRRG
jgi:radical SAM protein with 4Fe4S-binding SPASM domain